MGDQRTTPASAEIEANVLGCAMLDPELLDNLDASIRPQDFYWPSHRQIWAVILGLRKQQAAPVASGVRDEITARGWQDKTQGRGAAGEMLDGLGYIDHLVSVAYTPTFAADVMRLLDLSRCRQGLDACYALVQRLETGSVDALDELSAGATNLAQLAERDGVAASVNAGDLAHTRLGEIEAVQRERNELLARGQHCLPHSSGFQTSIYKWDRLLAGMPPGEICMIAARPSVGKTLVGLNVMWSAAVQHDTPVGVLSLEMYQNQVIDRMLCIGSWEGTAQPPAEPSDSGADSGKRKKEPQPRWLSRPGWISTDMLRTGAPLSGQQRARLDFAARQLKGAPLYIDYGSELSINDVRVRIREMHRRHRIQAVMIDYLGLLHCREEGNRAQEIGEQMKALKGLAGQLGIAVILLAQLSRVVETRGDKRPQLSDFRDSGVIEEHAYAVNFLYRELYYDQERNEQLMPGELETLEIHVAKNRNGSTGVAKIMLCRHAGRLVNT